MGDVPLPADLSTLLAEMERRIRTLETAPRLQNSSVSDVNGVARTFTGLLPSGDYGFEVHNDSGATVFQVLSTGVSIPRAPMAVTKANDYVIVTNATYDNTWTMACAVIVADAVQIAGAVTADIGTTGEVRVMSPLMAGTVYTSVLTVTGGTQLNYDFKWKTPGLAVGTGPATYYLQVRRTGGAGNVNVYAPTQAHMAASTAINATPTGV